MKYSLYDLSFLHLTKLFKDEPPNDIKKRNINTIYKCLINGWTTEDILEGIENNRDLKIMANNIKNDEYNKNLIDPKKYYYHNLLRIYPDTPVVDWDINSGTFEISSEEYFLETRASITIKQILQYYLERFETDYSSLENSRNLGSIKHLIFKYGIEKTLFLIDATDDLIKSNSINTIIKTPVQMSEYIGFANEKYENRKNTIKMAGDDKIVYKKRIFPNRNRG